MKRFLQPIVGYFYNEFFYVLCGGYEKELTKRELMYIDVGALLARK